MSLFQSNSGICFDEPWDASMSIPLRQLDGESSTGNVEAADDFKANSKTVTAAVVVIVNPNHSLITKKKEKEDEEVAEVGRLVQPADQISCSSVVSCSSSSPELSCLHKTAGGLMPLKRNRRNSRRLSSKTESSNSVVINRLFAADDQTTHHHRLHNGNNLSRIDVVVHDL
jgi:hypothetical protein